MKSTIRTFTAATAAIITLITSLPETKAADVTLDGAGYYNLATRTQFYPTGAAQSGRFTNLGRDNYHRANMGVDWMSNNSGVSSGSLSFEFWGMPFYGARRGIILMTKSVWALAPYRYHSSLSVSGNAVFLNAYRYPELNLWEYTRKGWKFRDSLTFRRNNLL